MLRKIASMTKNTLIKVAVAGMMTSSASAFAAIGPEINLFPESVLSEFEITTESANKMETGLQDVFTKLNNQKKAYDGSTCEGDPTGSAGCAEMVRLMTESYLEMLQQMSSSLPELKSSVSNAETILRKKLVKDIAKKTTPDGLQEYLLNSIKKTNPANSQKKRGTGLAKMLDTMMRRISTGNTARQNQISEASEIYLDMREASGIISQMQAQISSQMATARVALSLGSPPQGMDQTINEVSTLIFGEEDVFIEEDEIATDFEEVDELQDIEF